MKQPIRRILVPTDFSEPAAAALEYACALAHDFGASVHVLHVLDESAFDGGPTWAGGMDFESSRTGLLERVRTRLGLIAHGASVEAIFGDVASTISDYAWQIHADLIAIGTHGRTGLPHLLVGSIAEQVMRIAPCPVLTVRRQPGRTVQAALRPAVAHAE